MDLIRGFCLEMVFEWKLQGRELKLTLEKLFQVFQEGFDSSEFNFYFNERILDILFFRLKTYNFFQQYLLLHCVATYLERKIKKIVSSMQFFNQFNKIYGKK